MTNDRMLLESPFLDETLFETAADTRRADGTDRFAVEQELRRTGKQRPAPPPLDGRLLLFTARVIRMPVAVHVPPAAVNQSSVDVLFYVHGLLHPCPTDSCAPAGLITDAPFELGAIVEWSKRPVVLIVPRLDWSRPGGREAFGSVGQHWHALAKPANLNALIAEAMTELSKFQAGPRPSLRHLIVAGHSRAHSFFEPLAHSHADPDMRQGALANLRQLWSFDATYAGDVPTWKNWMATNPALRAFVFYRPFGDTKAVGDRFYARKGDGLEVTRVKEPHCDVPRTYLPRLLASQSPATITPEAEEYWSPQLDDARETPDDGWNAREADPPENLTKSGDDQSVNRMTATEAELERADEGSLTGELTADVIQANEHIGDPHGELDEPPSNEAEAAAEHVCREDETETEQPRRDPLSSADYDS